MPCMKEPFRSEGKAKEAIRRIRQRSEHKRVKRAKGGRIRGAYEARVYKCPECSGKEDRSIWHMASMGGELWK